MMRPLSNQEVLWIWETGLTQHPVDRALTILAAAFPELTPEESLALSIGQRDARLLAAREQTFGPRITGLVECPDCQGRLEFSVNVADLRVAYASGPANSVRQMTAGEFELRFRLLNSLDLKAVANCPDVLTARHRLVQRGVLQASRSSTEISSEALPEAVIVALASQMAACDPQAEVQLDLTCPVCGHGWPMDFDILSFFWTEISALAKRLLREVHTLARAYGWRETDILSMSAPRRQLYLEMVT